MSVETSAAICVRWMSMPRDLGEVVAIERLSFAGAWDEDDFRRCARQRGCVGMVAVAGERIVGYAIYELRKSSLHLLNFAVHPAWRRLGVGCTMVEALAQKLIPHRRIRVTLDVRETNMPAILFFRACGFLAVEVLRGFYQDSGEDAYRMEFRLPADVAKEVGLE